MGELGYIDFYYLVKGIIVGDLCWYYLVVLMDVVICLIWVEVIKDFIVFIVMFVSLKVLNIFIMEYDI